MQEQGATGSNRSLHDIMHQALPVDRNTREGNLRRRVKTEMKAEPGDGLMRGGRNKSKSAAEVKLERTSSQPILNSHHCDMVDLTTPPREPKKEPDSLSSRDSLNKQCNRHVESEVTPATPEPSGVRRLRMHFAKKSVMRRKRRQEAVAPLLAKAPKVSSDDSSLASRILSERNAAKTQAQKVEKPKEPTVPCLVIREAQLSDVVDRKCILQTYRVSKVKDLWNLHLILSTCNGSALSLVGKCQLVSSVKVDNPKQVHGFANHRHWLARLKEGLGVYRWKISDLEMMNPPLPMRAVAQKFRNRHFHMNPQAFSDGMQIPVPKTCSLYSTAGFFIKLLSTTDYQQLKETAESLDGYRLRVGTTCSGSDIGITALKSLLKEINREFKAHGLE
eukprot:s531_g15.t1